MVVAIVAFFGLREPGSGLCGRVVITADDAASAEERAALRCRRSHQRPWCQMLRRAILLSSLGYRLYNVSRYSFNLLLPTYLVG